MLFHFYELMKKPQKGKVIFVQRDFGLSQKG